MLEAGAPVEATDEVGGTALHLATWSHTDAVRLAMAQVESIRALVAAGASLGAQDSNGASPMDLAEYPETRQALAEAAKYIKKEL